MIWKVSSGPSLRRARAAASLAMAIGSPLMLPEQSSTKTISIGARGAAARSAGGCSIRVKKPPRCVAVGEEGGLDGAAGDAVAQDEVLVRDACRRGAG